MKIALNINYRTKWGEAVYVCGNIPVLGADCVESAARLATDNGADWYIEFEVADLLNLQYSYLIKTEDGLVLRREWGKRHSVNAEVDSRSIFVRDGWQDLPEDAQFYSTAFAQSIFTREKKPAKLVASCDDVLISVFVPMVMPNQEVAIVGESEALGHWDVNSAISLNASDFPKWSVALKKPAGAVEYKFIVRNAATHALVAWEFGENRVLEPMQEEGELEAISNLYFRNDITPWRGAGTAIPVFSLRSNEDYGVGDFYDLFKMIDWAEATGQKILQVLPINDTTMTRSNLDSYPYNANSTFALHPMYLRPDAIGELDDKAQAAEFRRRGDMLNQLPTVDYESSNELKESYTRALYKQMGKKVANTVAYRTFVKNNVSWLKPYAAYCVLRDMHNTSDFRDWGEYAEYNENKVGAFVAANADEIGYVYFVQYYLDKQLREVHSYARKHHVALKGDVPIGISSASADAWQNPTLFHMDCSAGAPPDDFAEMGQNWGFPTYNWEVMKRDGYQWWKNRFGKMAEYFDAYRIDHILGFFRIWQIPNECIHGLLGTFYPAKPFTAEEMRSGYDFWMNRERFTKPYIHERFLQEIFGEYTEDAKSRFMIYRGEGRYDLQDFVNTQRNVMKYFSQFSDDKTNACLREGLMTLIDDVLFIVDRYDCNKYHPRIDAKKTYIYQSLNEYEKLCFNNLYEDFFYHRHNDFWRVNAMGKLPVLTQSTEMLVCGEDLGMIPACVPDVMKSQKYLSLEIPRMPKEYGVEFGNTYNYPYLSVATTSTHDMSGIREWWTENPQATQRYYNKVLWHQGDAPCVATPQLCREMVGKCLDAPSILCILPLQDWMAMDGDLRRADASEERINVPSKSRHYWRYRMHITLEQLLGEKSFTNLVKESVKHSGR